MSRPVLAVGVFDGVHRGHRRVLEALAAAGPSTVVTLDPHPVPGTKLLCTVVRRVELIREAGVADVRLARPDEPVDVGEATVVSGPHAPVRHAPGGIVRVPLVEGVSSELIRRLVAAGELEAAARALGRPFEVEGTVVEGDRRGRLLGFPTANLAVAPELLLPRFGIYAGAALGRRAAVSVGVNPHYGGAREPRVEAFLLDFDGDLYGRRLTVELWTRLRDELAFADEGDLVAQISRDVAAARGAARPV